MVSRSGLKEIVTIGIPRALLYYKYGVLWKSFFEALGFKVTVSKKTDRGVLEAGEAVSIDECCLASKVYMGHAALLVEDAAVDAIFVPCYASVNHRSGFCTKFQSLPDLVRATFRERGVQVVSVLVEDVLDAKKTKASFVELGVRLGANPKKASDAYKDALSKQQHFDAARAKHQRETMGLIKEYDKVLKKDKLGIEEPLMKILFVAHPYLSHDEYISGYIVEALERMGATVIFADEAPFEPSIKKSYEFSQTLPWLVNRHLAGAIMQYKQHVDGIVLLSAFPCGPDSMFDEAVIRTVSEVPILNLMVDAQSGSAGVETRIESFCDILKFQGKGSYFND